MSEKTNRIEDAVPTTEFALAPAWKWEPGESVEGYTIEASVNEGGFGQVYRATKDGKPYALKQLLQKYYADDIARRRLEREALLSSASECPPCVCRCVGDFSAAPIPFLVFEWIEGHSLRQLFPIGTSAPALERRRLGAQLCELLFHLDRAGFQHRDLHLGNAMMRSDGSLVVIDLGLSAGPSSWANGVHSRHREISRDEKQTGQTSLDAPPGFVQILHPGAYENRLIDHERDLYALGSCLYCLVTGHYPFARHPDGDRGTYLTCRGSARVPFTDAERAGDPELIVLIEDLLNWDREVGYPTVADVRRRMAEMRLRECGVVSEAPIVPGPPIREILEHLALNRFVNNLELTHSQIQTASLQVPSHSSGSGSQLFPLLSSAWASYHRCAMLDEPHLLRCELQLAAGGTVGQLVEEWNRKRIPMDRNLTELLSRSFANPTDELEKELVRVFANLCSAIRELSVQFTVLARAREIEQPQLAEVR